MTPSDPPHGEKRYIARGMVRRGRLPQVFAARHGFVRRPDGAGLREDPRPHRPIFPQARHLPLSCRRPGRIHVHGAQRLPQARPIPAGWQPAHRPPRQGNRRRRLGGHPRSPLPARGPGPANHRGLPFPGTGRQGPGDGKPPAAHRTHVPLAARPLGGRCLADGTLHGLRPPTGRPSAAAPGARPREQRVQPLQPRGHGGHARHHHRDHQPHHRRVQAPRPAAMAWRRA